MMLSFLKKKLLGVSIIILGRHTASWMEALGESARVWKELPLVRRVSIVDLQNLEQLKKIKTRRPTVVLPILEDHIEKCPEKYLRLVPSKMALQILRNKQNFYEYVQSLGLTDLCPKHYENLHAAVYPCVLKRVDLNAGSGIAIVKSKEELLTLLRQELWRDRTFILQEYIPGTIEFVFHCVCDQGQLIWHCAYAYELPAETVKTSGTHISMNKTEIPEAQIKEIQKFLLPLKYTGPCNIDYKLNADGELKIFEINPRMGGSLMDQVNISDLKELLRQIVNYAA